MKHILHVEHIEYSDGVFRRKQVERDLIVALN